MPAMNVLANLFVTIYNTEARRKSECVVLPTSKIAKEAFSSDSSGTNLPSVKLNKNLLNDDINIIDLMIFSKLQNSKSEIRRLIKGNAIKLNDKIVNDEKFILSDDLFNNGYVKLSIGKKII